MSFKAIYKHFQKDPMFYTESQDGGMYVSLANEKGEQCEIYLVEYDDPVMGKMLFILAPIAEVARVDVNKLLSIDGPLTTNIASWRRFGVKISGDDLCLQKFMSSDQEPLFVRRQAVMMAWSARALANAVRK